MKVMATTQKENSFFYTVKVHITLAEFVHRMSDFILDPFFARTVERLPKNYVYEVVLCFLTKSFQPYFIMFKEYGTAYTHRGVMGGSYTMTYQYKR